MNILNFIILSLLYSFTSYAQHHHHSKHGFILLGSKQLHAYHLAKFDSPHEYQIIFELELFNSNGDHIDIEQLKKEYNTKVLSLLSSEQFLIKDLVSNTPVKEFSVELYAGYLRDTASRRLIYDNLKLKIKKINYFKKISRLDINTQVKKMILICDERAQESYLAQKIEGLIDNTNGNFEEIHRISFYIGSAGEDSPSYILPCDKKIQATEIEILNHDDAPLRIEPYLIAKVKEDFYAIFNFYPLFIDQNAVNN